VDSGTGDGGWPSRRRRGYPDPFTDFEGFKTGASINGQNGWARTGPYDEQVVNAGGNTVWRVSNATASGSFGDMPFAPRFGGIPANTVSNPTNGSPAHSPARAQQEPL